MKGTARMEEPWWFGSTEGMTNRVPPPWTPVTVEQTENSLHVCPWGRRYGFSSSVFPEQIWSSGRSILAGPVRVVARVNGRKQRWNGRPPSLTESSSARAVLSLEAESGFLHLSARTEVEYDGVLRVDWKVEPRTSVVLEELTFEVPLKRNTARYYYHYPAEWGTPDAGSLPGKELSITVPLYGQDKKTYGNVQGFRPLIWLGDEERGLAWFSESDRNWYAKKGGKVTQIVTEGDRVVLRLHLVSVPLELSPVGESSEQERMIPPEEGPLKDLSYTFGLQATPVKPPTADVWDYRIIQLDQNALDRPEVRYDIPESVLDEFASRGVRTICLHEHWSDYEGYTSTNSTDAYAADVKALVEACHERGIQLLLYLGFLISDLVPEWSQVGEQCKVLPPYSGYQGYSLPPQPKQSAYVVCYQSLWQDAIAAGVGRMMDEYGIDGVYLDGTEVPWGCLNRKHGCGYERPDGTRALSYPFFAVRDLMRRIYVAVKQRKPDGQVNAHNSTAMTIPTLAWATSYWGGEQFGKAGLLRNGTKMKPGDCSLDVLPLDAFRTEFMGHQWGVPAEFLSRRGAPFTRLEAYAFTLLHDVLVREGYENHYELLELQSRLWRLSDEFGRKEANWIPYWKNEGYAAVAPAGAYVSLYDHPRNGVLAVVSNLSRKQETVRVRLDLGKLGIAATPVHVHDALNNQQIEMNDQTIQFPLPSSGWRIVWLRP